MATRAYRRDSKGKFAGAGGGSMVTYGKAGGFANSAFRARTSATNQKASTGKSLGAAVGARGRSAARGAGGFVRRHPHITGKILGVGGVIAAGQISRAVGQSRANARVNRSLGLASKTAAAVRADRGNNLRMGARATGRRGRL